MGMAAAKIYCICEEVDSQKKFIKMYNGYKLDKTTRVFKNEDTIEFIDAPSGLLIKKYDTKNMSEAIRLFNADEALKTNLETARNKPSYIDMCNTLNTMINEHNKKEYNKI